MPGCAKMRKATCQENGTCVWIVGKGCREQKNMPKKLVSPKSAPLKCQFHMPTTLIKKTFKEVHPDYNLSSKVPEFLEKLLKRLLKHMFGGAETQTYTQDSLGGLLFKTLQSREIAKHVNSEGTKMMQHYKIMKQKPIQASFVNKNSKTIMLSDDLKLYLTGVVVYFMAELLDKGGKVAYENKRKIVTIEHITTAIKKDDDFVDFAKYL